MDLYLEDYLWPDVHSALAHKIRQQLAPQIQPKYVARIEIAVIEDQIPEAEIGLMYPNVEVIKVRSSRASLLEADAPIMAPLTIPLPQVRLATVEIRDTAQHILVTSIEILSPVNKREPNLSHYRQKRERLRKADVHLLEIDLLRRGTRAWTHPRIPEVPYLVLLTRAQASAVEVWPIKLQDKLPTLPVPLRPPTQTPSWIYPRPSRRFTTKPFTTSRLITPKRRRHRRYPLRNWPGYAHNSIRLVKREDISKPSCTGAIAGIVHH
jgi:hypothetical protein